MIYRADANCAVQHGAERATCVARYSQLRKSFGGSVGTHSLLPAVRIQYTNLNGLADFLCNHCTVRS